MSYRWEYKLLELNLQERILNKCKSNQHKLAILLTLCLW